MADTFTSSLRLQLQQTGANATTWGAIADTQFQKLESAVTGDNGFGAGGGIDLTGQTSGTFALTTNNGTLDQAAQLLYPFVGVLTANFTVLIPGVVKMGWVLNQTSGGHDVILRVGSGSALTIPPGGEWTFFYCDGTNVIAPAISFASGIGPITVNGNATINGTATISGALIPSSSSLLIDPSGVGTKFGGAVTISNDSAFFLGTNSGQHLIQFTTGNFIQNTALGLNIASALAVTLNGTAVQCNAPVTISSGTALAGVGTFMTPSGGVSAPSTAWTTGVALNAGSQGIIGGIIIANSDERLKRDIEDITDTAAIEWIEAAKPKTFTMDGRPSTGFVAQDDAQNLRARAVYTVPDLRFEDGRHAIDYNQHIAFLTAALQVSLRRIGELTERIDALEAEID